MAKKISVIKLQKRRTISPEDPQREAVIQKHIFGESSSGFGLFTQANASMRMKAYVRNIDKKNVTARKALPVFHSEAKNVSDVLRRIGPFKTKEHADVYNKVVQALYAGNREKANSRPVSLRKEDLQKLAKVLSEAKHFPIFAETQREYNERVKQE